MKKFNTLLTKDEKNNSVYIFLPPFHPTNNIPKVKNSEQLESHAGIISIDYNNLGQIVGIEISDGNRINL